MEVVQETESPTGIPRHAYETPIFTVRPGASELHWDSWPRIDDAIASYHQFRRLRDEGVIPAHLRFQVGLPFPSSALNAFKADFANDDPVAARAFEDLAARELTRLTTELPSADLAIQWDSVRAAGRRRRARMDLGRRLGTLRRTGVALDATDP